MPPSTINHQPTIIRTIIIANGNLNHPDSDRLHLRPDDFIIAADGGANHCSALGIRPDVVIGDLDSARSRVLADLEADGVDIIRYPARKDQADLELAIDLAVSRGPDEILILGALGGRWDMTLTNMLLLIRAEQAGIACRLVDGPQEIRIIQGKKSLTVNGAPGDTLSLVPLGDDVGGVTLTGMEYPLNQATLQFGGSRGVSNTLTTPGATVTVETGRVICILIRKGESG